MKKTPEEVSQERRDVIVKDILRERYLKLHISGDYIIKENLKTEETKIICKVMVQRKDEMRDYDIEGVGCGPIDAFFNSLLVELSKEYRSLETFQFSALGMTSKSMLRDRDMHYSGSDAPVEAILSVINERGEYLYFRNKSRSLSRAAIRSVLDAIEHFVNTEEAVGIVRKTIEDARRRNRGDIIDDYTSKLIELVKATDYHKKEK